MRRAPRPEKEGARAHMISGPGTTCPVILVILLCTVELRLLFVDPPYIYSDRVWIRGEILVVK
jgi:hypothetical protein